MLFLRIRQAEVALSDGRLEEAFELCQPQDVRSHRRGQSLVTGLVRALVKRGQDHLAADRAAQALVDCEKAARLGGNLPEVLALRSAASDAVAQRHRSERRHAQALIAAREHIEAGRLATGQQFLAEAGDESRATVLLRDVNARRTMFEAKLQAAQAAFDRDDLATAASELLKARQTDSNDPRLTDLCLHVCKGMRDQIASSINEGRLDLADSLVQRLSKLDDQSVETKQYQRAVAQYRQAWEAIDRGQPRRADELLRRLTNLFPDARWLKDALKSVAQAEEALEALRGGPLGLLSGTGIVRGDAPTEVPAKSITGFQPLSPIAHGLKTRDTAQDDALPSRFIIQVDGAGSFCVVRQPLVTLGPVSSSRVPDVGLIAEPNAPVVSIERNDDDYFIRATGPITVNDREASNKLLMRGDRIGLSPRCRMTFNLPNPASTSATIDLTAGRFPRADVRRIILLDRDLIIGPGTATHIRVDQIPGNIILLVRDGRLYVQSDSPVTVDGRPSERSSGIPLGGHVDVGGLSFVVTRG